MATPRRPSVRENMVFVAPTSRIKSTRALLYHLRLYNKILHAQGMREGMLPRAAKANRKRFRFAPGGSRSFSGRAHVNLRGRQHTASDHTMVWVDHGAEHEFRRGKHN
ncbi:hypothetical protein Salat_2623800 [Sesamum alatum]|uniref:Uncharacterized protein n=1 Tax=Sesamum alatum TaxID=300844 RepID=A0AAE1XNM4_9LAMI|nr:hypothetical protein Salat_2623800 [Sesamum alatum]